MPRTCSVCAHSKLDEINTALLEAEPMRQIVERFGSSIGSLQRHKEHLPVTISAAKEARDIVTGGTLLEQVRSLHVRTLAILERAEAAGQLETCLKAIREARNNLELLARMDGELKDQGGNGSAPVTINVQYIDKALSVRGASRSELIDAEADGPGGLLA